MRISHDNKRFLRTLFYLAPPIIIQEILNTSVNLLDTIMIGKCLGSNEIAAVGLANQIFFIFSIILFGVNSGSSIFIGQYWGKEDKKSILKTMGIGFSFNTLVSAFFTVMAFFFPSILMDIYTDDPVVIAIGVDYLKVISLSYFMTSITVTRNAALRSTGQTRLPMFTTCIALLVNLTFNYIFIFKLNLGVAGAALSTLIARIVEISAQHILVHKLRMPIIGKFKDYFSADKEYVKYFFKFTTFVILNEAVWAIGTSVYYIAYSYCGTQSQAAWQIGQTIMQIFQVFGMAVGSACAIMLSNALGAGEQEKAIRYSRKCIVMAFAVSCVMSALLLIFYPAVISFYNVEAEVVAMASKLIFVIAFATIPKTINYTTICGILRSGGDTRYCFWLDGLSVWCVGIPLGFFGAVYLGLPIHWVVLMTFSEEIFKFIFALRRSLSNIWAKTLV